LFSLTASIKHLYDFIKSGGFLKMKDKIKLSPFTGMTTSDKNIYKLLYIMYIIEMNEIEAYYHSDIRNFKENKHKFNNDIKKYLKYCRLQRNLNYLNNNDIKDIVDEIPKADKNVIVKLYYSLQKEYKIRQEKIHNTASTIKILGIQFRKFLDNNDIINIKYTEQEVDNFYKSLEKEVERKKKIYRRYIERLYSYFS
jgi:MFS superfamily sulfate permease-like transporter